MIRIHPFKAPAQTKKNTNPLNGKGKSYGKHVEDGWGKFVQSIQSQPNDDPFDIDDLWNGSGRW